MNDRDGEWTYPGPRKVPYGPPPTWHDLMHKWEDLADEAYRLMLGMLVLHVAVAVLLILGWAPRWLILVSGLVVVASVGLVFYSRRMRDTCRRHDMEENDR